MRRFIRLMGEHYNFQLPIADLYEFFENIEFNDEDVDEDLLNNLDEILMSSDQDGQ